MNRLNAVLLSLIFVPSTFQAAFFAADQVTRAERAEPSIPVHLAVLRNKLGAHPKDRCDAAQALGRQTDARALRDQDVVETLCSVAKDGSDDLFVRMDAMNALGDLQYNVFSDDHARARYTVPFIGILENTKEEELLRTRVVQILGRTLQPGQPLTQKAVIALAASAKERGEALILRVTCIDALGSLGAADEIVDLVGSLLFQPGLDDLLKEHLLNAFAQVLDRVQDPQGIRVATLIRLKELTLDPKTPLELRALGLESLARLKRAQVVKSLELMPEIRAILKQESNMGMVLAAIRSIGILDETDGVPTLIETYHDFFDTGNVNRPADLEIRTQTIRTLGGLLSAQAACKRPNAESLRLTADLFLSIIEPSKENLEVDGVREEAVFALRYLYPKRPEFQRFHRPVAERLIEILKAGEEAGANASSIVTDTLVIITRYPGKDLTHWEQWFKKTYGQPVTVESPAHNE